MQRLLTSAPNILKNLKCALKVFKNTITTTGHNRKPIPQYEQTFLNGSSAQYIEEMYNAWVRDPKSVHTVS